MRGNCRLYIHNLLIRCKNSFLRILSRQKAALATQVSDCLLTRMTLAELLKPTVMQLLSFDILAVSRILLEGTVVLWGCMLCSPPTERTRYLTVQISQIWSSATVLQCMLWVSTLPCMRRWPIAVRWTKWTRCCYLRIRILVNRHFTAAFTLVQIERIWLIIQLPSGLKYSCETYIETRLLVSAVKYKRSWEHKL